MKRFAVVPVSTPVRPIFSDESDASDPLSDFEPNPKPNNQKTPKAIKKPTFVNKKTKPDKNSTSPKQPKKRGRPPKNPSNVDPPKPKAKPLKEGVQIIYTIQVICIIWIQYSFLSKIFFVLACKFYLKKTM